MAAWVWTLNPQCAGQRLCPISWRSRESYFEYMAGKTFFTLVSHLHCCCMARALECFLLPKSKLGVSLGKSIRTPAAQAKIGQDSMLQLYRPVTNMPLNFMGVVEKKDLLVMIFNCSNGRPRCDSFNLLPIKLSLCNCHLMHVMQVDE